MYISLALKVAGSSLLFICFTGNQTPFSRFEMGALSVYQETPMARLRFLGLNEAYAIFIEFSQTTVE